MDTNWCTICGQHIDFSDTDLYCSEKCRKSDELPSLLPSTFTIHSPISSITPSPTLTYSFISIGSSKVSPSSIHLDSTNKGDTLRHYNDYVPNSLE
ncbi:hypothetical protein K502DRAFT_322392 [Neoconidiobolus thromboides FSU 785]|nr:hypothetical protein K502DRAFT_322392 [Neoconidiobolus thromboides FSU 785]